MKITGIICEYNPFHLGHFKQIQSLTANDPENTIVCLMSGNYVQRGAPAIYDKMLRAKAAVACGADLVLELPVTAALSSAEGFANQSVAILGSFCDCLSFGAETNDGVLLQDTAQALLSNTFASKLKDALAVGDAFPVARQKALEMMGLNGNIITKPNNILAVEYYKAILSQNSKMKPIPILRQGNYHDTLADKDNPSASALRNMIENNLSWTDYIPKNAKAHLENAPIHTLKTGEQAILYRLRTMTDAEFEALPYGSEGLWRKLMHNSRCYNSLEEILSATKSKRYTRTRLDRMIMCAYLQLTQADILSPPPYVRVLALNDRGRQALLKARECGHFPNIGQLLDSPYQEIESRCDDLYGLFAIAGPESPKRNRQSRIFYQK